MTKPRRSAETKSWRPAIDRIRDGATDEELSRNGYRAVWNHLVSTAASWQSKGKAYQDWIAVVREKRSVLGQQAWMINRTRERSDVEYRNHLRKAWEAAENFRKTAPPVRTAQDFRWEAAELGEALDSLPDADWTLNDWDRRILRHVLAQAEVLGSSTPTIPCRPAAQALGLPEESGRTAVSRSLKDLVAAGWLELVERGRVGAGSGRASRYRVTSTAVSRLGCDSEVPNTSVSHSPEVRAPLLSHTSSGSGGNPTLLLSHTLTHPSTIPVDQEEKHMITAHRSPEGELTFTLPEVDGAFETLARVLTEAGIPVQSGQPEQQVQPGGTVVRLDVHRRRSSS